MTRFGFADPAASPSRTAQVLPAASLGGPMPWVIAIMVALTVLATGGALALANFARDARSALEGGVTIQIVEADAAARMAQLRSVEQALTNAAGIADVRVIPQSEIEALVEPWLGEAAASDAVTLPAMIEVRLADRANPQALARLRAIVATASPAARVDAQADWLGPVFAAIRALHWLAIMLIVLLTLASAAAVWLAARNALDANRATIEIVHHLGGGDRQIARMFERSVLVDALAGGGAGLVLGGGALLILGARFGALQSGVVQSGALSASDWLLVALVPVIMAGVALFTARRTVLARLGRML